MTSTKPIDGVRTYAQNSCCGAALQEQQVTPRYQSNSVSKLLIYIGILNCFFSGQFKESLDLQGFAGLSDKLSTKLSTENLEILKATINQRLSAFFGCIFEEVPINGYPK
ncbi:MAG: hypothetical protein JJD98_05110 [Polaromonas sp.]|nr:hypothetical protein [Polaromonas sp.]